MSRGGRKSERDGPERRCIATGVSGPKSGLIRFVIGPDAAVVADLSGKLPGRGIWVSADRPALEAASKKGLFARAAKAQVKVPEDLAQTIEDGLVARIVATLSMARKAGQGVAGYEKVKSWLETGEASILIQASDGSERGKGRLRSPGVFIGELTAQQLGLAFGREHVIHAALAAGGLAERIGEDAMRLSGVRGTISGGARGKVKKTV